MGEYRKLYDEELPNLYCSPNVIRVIKVRRIFFFFFFFFFFFLLSLVPQPSLDLALLLKIQLNFFEASQQFSLLQGRVVSPTPNSYPGGPGLCIYIPQRQGDDVMGNTWRKQ
jgi:hypothetical protein